MKAFVGGFWISTSCEFSKQRGSSEAPGSSNKTQEIPERNAKEIIRVQVPSRSRLVSQYLKTKSRVSDTTWKLTLV